MSGQRVRRVSVWLIAALFVLGCVSPFFAATPTQLPAQAPALDSLGTLIVQTADAAQTQTAVAMPSAVDTSLPAQTLLPTLTLAPTQTPLMLVSLTPTSTPGFLIVATDGSLVSVTPAPPTKVTATSNRKATATKKPAGGAVIKEPKEWECEIVDKSPDKDAVIAQGLNFYAYWTVLNTGTKSWPNYGIDFIYMAGLRSTGRVIQDLPLTVTPGRQVTLRVPLTAPRNVGTYNVIWSLQVGNTYFCPMRITFEVQ